ncbi:acetylajmalan esterase-like [Phragmites australis]|uniref:acetylajmalan esterase-like n=1 Tax=Phragmites australis TaxID=29695 RepID=UPI002D772511|nr:acetylajmalan esterase-like [Phragmites australis]
MDLLLGRVLVAFLLAGASSSTCLGAAATSTVDGITTIYNFGDSISDTGNLVREGAPGLLQYIAKLPYGIDMHGDPTGRCSDGYLMIDFLAKDLCLPLLNPYLDKSLDFTHGVNFAVAGATALDTTTLAKRGITISLTNSSLDVQLKWFKDFMGSTTNSTQEIRKKLETSLVMLGEIGGNDYNYAFLQTWSADGGYGLYNVTRVIKSVAQAVELVPEVVQSIANAAKELLEMGAVRLVIPGNFPVGCVPSYLATVNVTEPIAYDDDGCLAALNVFAELHNARLQGAVADLRRSYPRATIAYADYYAAYVRILREARALGFDAARTRTACCGAGGGPYNFDVDRMCGAPGTSACADPGGYVSWDGVHMTQHAYGVMAELLYRGGLADPAPINWPGQKMGSPVN